MELMHYNNSFAYINPADSHVFLLSRCFASYLIVLIRGIGPQRHNILGQWNEKWCFGFIELGNKLFKSYNSELFLHLMWSAHLNRGHNLYIYRLYPAVIEIIATLVHRQGSRDQLLCLSGDTKLTFPKPTSLFFYLSINVIKFQVVYFCLAYNRTLGHEYWTRQV